MDVVGVLKVTLDNTIVALPLVVTVTGHLGIHHGLPFSGCQDVPHNSVELTVGRAIAGGWAFLHMRHHNSVDVDGDVSLPIVKGRLQFSLVNG